MSVISAAHSQLQAVFAQLDYLDDGYQSGFVSHVGLRRIILETPEFEAEVGPTFARALLSHAERNLYGGHLNFEKFVVIYRQVAAYTLGQQQRQAQQYQVDPASIYQMKLETKTPRNVIHRAAVVLALPKEQRDDHILYMDRYSCRPPPMLMLLISIAQIGVFVWHILILSNKGKSIKPNGPIHLDGDLIFNPMLKWQAWRFLTYMLVHSGYFHIIFNVLIQLIIGIPLEMVHRWWRILIIYSSGVVAGSLVTSLVDPNVFLAGASGGVYALILAHVANVILNWKEMEYPALRILAFVLLTALDIGMAVYYRYIVFIDTRIAYSAHLAGASMGLFTGIVVLRNLKKRPFEKVIWWGSLVCVLITLTVTIVWNCINIWTDINTRT